MTVVVKLGSGLVAGPGGRVRRSLLRARGQEICRIVRGGEPVCVVSSGAIALGLPRLGLAQRPRSVAQLQAASALGQARLQAAWEAALAPIPAAQVLLTAADVGDRTTYVNARGAIGALFAFGAVPVVNENDATATDEITFGDNDALAAQVAVLLRAGCSSCSRRSRASTRARPGTPGAELIAEGYDVGDAALGDTSPLGRGGMRSKVLAAELAAAAGIPTVIAAGTGESVLEPILAGEPRGTRFAGAERSESAFKLWLRFGKPVRGPDRGGPRGAHGRWSIRERACSASALSPVRVRSSRATQWSSSAPTAPRSQRGSPRCPRASSRAGLPASKPCTATA